MEESRVIQKEDAEKLKEEYGIEYFIESSAKTGFNVQEIFIKAAKLLFHDYILYNNAQIKPEKIHIHNSQISKEDNDGKSKCC